MVDLNPLFLFGGLLVVALLYGVTMNAIFERKNKSK